MPAAPISSSVLRPSLIDQRHAHHGEDQVGGADRDRLLVAGDLAESSRRKDVVQVIENRVDPRQLIECPNRDGQKQRIAILPLKDRLMRRGMFLPQALRGCRPVPPQDPVRPSVSALPALHRCDSVRPTSAGCAESRTAASGIQAPAPPQRPPASATPPRPGAA